MAAIDRLNGLASETTLGIKAPCLVATTASITLAGVQAIDGITVGNASERVLVKDQADPTQNGIYIASSGNWTRAQDAGGNTDWAAGTLVYISAGSVNANSTRYQTATGPIIIGSSGLQFSLQQAPAIPANTLLGPQSTNPYTAVYPPGIAYPNWLPLINSSIYTPDGTLSVNSRLLYGNLQTASVAAFAANSNRPGFINGYTADSQIGTIQEVGGGCLGAQIDAVPYLFAAVGSFGASTFTPSTNLNNQTVNYPFGSPATATMQSLLKVNMWLVTNDPIPFYGRVTNVGNGSGITVGGWYQLGSAVAGTPSGTIVYANPQNYAWAFLPELFLNKLGKSIAGVFTAPTGSPQSGTKNITGVSDTTGCMVGQLISGTGIPAGSAITAYTSNSITINQNCTSSPGAVSLTISVWPGNFGAISEFDLANLGPAFSPLTPVSMAGGTATLGSNTITGLTVPSTVRQGHIIYTPSAGLFGAKIVSTTPTSITLNQQANANVAGTVTVVAFSAFDEGGVGIDMASIANNANTAYTQRGNFSYGFVSQGAADTSFMMRLTGFAAVPLYGFRVDGSIVGFPSAACFAVTNGANTPWSVDGSGNMTAATGLFTGLNPVRINGAAGSFRLAQFQTAGSQRWDIGAGNGTESGGNAGSDFALLGYADDGSTLLGNWLQINRANGAATLQSLVTTAAARIGTSLGVGVAAASSAFAALAAGTTVKSQINLAVGVAPTSPNDGDLWYESGALKFRVGGTTKTFTLA